MRRTEPNQLYQSKRVTGTQPCLYRCIVTKFEIVEKGNKVTGTVTREKILSTLTNQCRLKINCNKTCSHPNDSEITCHIPRR